MSLCTTCRPLAALSACLLLAAPAWADDPVSGVFLLDTELYRDLEGAFGEVLVEEDGEGGLHFQVALDPEVAGSRARLRRVLLSLADWPSGLSVVPDDPDAMRMWMRGQPHPWLTMGARFGGVVKIQPRHERRRRSFWPWHRPRRAPLHEAGFTLVADEPLALGDVLAMTATWRGTATQIGVQVHELRMHRRYRGFGLLGGLFEADPPPVDEEPPPDDQEVPEGCFGIVDPATGEITQIICP